MQSQIYIDAYISHIGLYYIHFEIPGDRCSLIGSQQCEIVEIKRFALSVVSRLGINVVPRAFPGPLPFSLGKALGTRLAWRGSVKST